jgi:hypothetical protein
MTLGLASHPILNRLADLLAASPPVLFFFLGIVAAMVKSNLAVPKAVTKLLSLYLLWAIGFKGGAELATHGLPREAAAAMLAGLALALGVPVYVFTILRRITDVHNAAALAASYGSVGVVTFLTASTMLEARGIPYGGHMVAVMAIMESPAIIAAVLLVRRADKESRVDGKSRGKLLHEAFLNGPVLLLMGSLCIGLITGERGYRAFKPLCTDLFSGVLVFFLLDLGLLAARRWKDLRTAGKPLIAFGIAIPILNASLSYMLARLGGLSQGDTMLLMALGASASYIAVPAAARLVLPKANPGIYVPMALAVTFPFNVGVGLPIFLALATR